MAEEGTPVAEGGEGRQPDHLAQRVDAEQPPHLPFPVIGIGASAGGLEAVSEFLDAMRPDSGMAFVVVQHLAPDRESQVAEILARHTAMPVSEVEDGMAVQQDHVYVIRPGHVLTIRDGRLHLGPPLRTPRAANRPIDDFFRSLAEEQRERAVCVVLSDVRRSRDQLEAGVRKRTAELRAAHEQAMQAERLAAVGQALTALAHEGRNALQRAHACLSMLGFRLEGKPEEEDLAGRTRQALEDLQRLFDDIRGYAGPVVLDVRACDLREVWREAWSQVLVLYPGRDARLEDEPGAKSLAREADPFRLGQVFRNLFANALDACPDPARVAVSCQEVLQGERPALRVTVRDNGPGFTPEQREHAFEPFHTTKAKGTGLGLAIAKRIVEAHGGTIAVEASAAGGATIGLVLPQKQG